MKGWSVAIKRKDGSEFLCSSGIGDVPPVWVNSNRRFAVVHKRSLRAAGFDCRVVKIEYEPTTFARSAAQETNNV